MKRAVSLRRQMLLLMVLLVVLQAFALVFSLTVSQVFARLDAEAFRLFNSTTSARMQTYNNMVGDLVGNMAGEAKLLNQRFAALAREEGVPPAQMYLDDEAYLAAAATGAETVISLLRNNTITGAFFILGGSNANKQAPEKHSAVYIRNSAPGSVVGDTGSYVLEVGPIGVSQQWGMGTSVNWNIEMDVAAEEADYYTQPMWAAQEYPRAEIERYGFWTPPSDILRDRQQGIVYTLPLLDEAGVPYGVVGVEISLQLFNQYYLPNAELPYQNSFYIIAAHTGGALDLDWYIPGGPLAEVYLKQEAALPLQAVAGGEVYETELSGLGEMYCSVHPLVMYSQNSPFYDESWTLTGFVPKAVLHGTSAGVRQLILISFAVTTALSFAAILVMVLLTTRRISGLSRYVKSLSPYDDIHFNRTGIREIDDLTAAVERLSQNVVNASKTTSKILELTLLPIGGFEVTSEGGGVTVTEYIYQLMGLAPGTPVSAAQWQAFHQKLRAHPVPGYDNIYRYGDEEEPSWLRIVETETDGGLVGVVLDVSRDVEEQRRLAHELDYDALTHLYNRVAFKREANQKMQRQPQKVGAMIFADLDNLKYINDTFGHDMGDRLIIRAGEMFREFERLGGVVSRISGDEFAIYLHGFATKDEARQMIYGQYEKNEFYKLNTPDGLVQKIRCSSGVAFYPEDSDNVTDLLKLADFAMYEAKHRRKGAIFEFDRATYQQNAYLLENREAINRLLDEGLIRFAYQPIVDLKTGDIFAYEALMRSELEAFKSPLEILSVAAAQSKLGQLERLVMLKGFQAVEEHRALLGNKKMFFNSIPSQTLTDEDHLLLQRDYKHLFPSIVIEITEAENDAPQYLQSKLAFIRKNGMQIAIDDFGSGYSNEIRILSMAPDIVKVDIELISGIDTDADKQKLVANLISFCHPKGVKLIAEGVERKEELAELIRMDMDYVQGYYTARPAFELRALPEETKQEILALRAQMG